MNRPAANDLARKAAELASHDIGQREFLGKNDSPRIVQYGATVGIKPPSPYCAAAVSTWIAEAANWLNWKFQLFRYSASALRLLERNPTLFIFPKQLEPQDLPCVAVWDVGQPGGDGHTGLAIGADFDKGTFQTIEANSNHKGSRDGGGVYALDIRKFSDKTLKGFLRIA